MNNGEQTSSSKVSVVLTSYNHGKYIREAIDSVLNQTFTDFELIIWDDTSSDNSWEIICSYDDVRIKSHRNNQNTGGGNINRALEVAQGEYIAIHHSDDVWELDKLEKQVAFLDAHPSMGAVFTNVLAIGEDSQPLNHPEHFYTSIFDQPNRSRYEWLNYFFYRGNALCHPSVLIRKQCYELCGLYQHGLAQLPDFDMWIRLCLQYEIHVLPEKLVRFRVRAGEANTSGDRLDVRVRSSIEQFQVLKHYVDAFTTDEIFLVFPEAKKYVFGALEEANTNFIVAMYLLETDRPYAKSLAFDILFGLIGDSKSAVQLKAVHGFDYLDLIKLTGKNDIFMVDLANALNVHSGLFLQLETALLQRDAVMASVDNLKRSHSWRLTAPLRFFSQSIKRLLTSEH